MKCGSGAPDEGCARERAKLVFVADSRTADVLHERVA